MKHSLCGLRPIVCSRAGCASDYEKTGWNVHCSTPTGFAGTSRPRTRRCGSFGSAGRGHEASASACKCKEGETSRASDVGEREREPLLPRNHRGATDRQSGARASVAELEAGLIGERTDPDMLESTPAFNYISLVAKKFHERA